MAAGSVGFGGTAVAAGYALASVDDYLTITSPGRYGYGYLTLAFTIDGDYGGSIFTEGAIPVTRNRVRLNYSWDGSMTSQFAIATGGSETILLKRLLFYFGRPTYIKIGMEAEVQIVDNGAPGISAQLYADYLHTALMSGIEVMDANQVPLTDFTITSASGTDYPMSAEAPEPATVGLILTALPWLGRRLLAGVRGGRRGRIPSARRDG